MLAGTQEKSQIICAKLSTPPSSFPLRRPFKMAKKEHTNPRTTSPIPFGGSLRFQPPRPVAHGIDSSGPLSRHITFFPSAWAPQKGPVEAKKCIGVEI